MPDKLGNEPEYQGCSVCGFWCKTDRDTRANRGHGEVLGRTTLSVAVSAGDTSITVASTTTFESTGTGYIYDSDEKTRDMFTYTGKTATTFTGIPSTGAYALEDHATTGVVVTDCYPKIRRGCPMCGSMNYLAGERKVRM